MRRAFQERSWIRPAAWPSQVLTSEEGGESEASFITGGEIDVRRAIVCIGAIIALLSVPLFAHHAAEGTVDEEIYEMISVLIEDTQHASWEPPVEIGDGVYEMSISTRMSRQFESMIDDGLLDYLAMLDGDVLITMTFNRRGGVELLVTQVKDE
jgi:hypothetical protein